MCQKRLKVQKVQKVDFGPGHLGPVKSSEQEKNNKTREIRVNIPKNDISLTVCRLDVSQLEVSKSQFWVL